MVNHARTVSLPGTVHEAAELGDIEALKQLVEARRDKGYPARYGILG
jgi:hypothetical protein